MTRCRPVTWKDGRRMVLPARDPASTCRRALMGSREAGAGTTGRQVVTAQGGSAEAVRGHSRPPCRRPGGGGSVSGHAAHAAALPCPPLQAHPPTSVALPFSSGQGRRWPGRAQCGASCLGGRRQGHVSLLGEVSPSSHRAATHTPQPAGQEQPWGPLGCGVWLTETSLPPGRLLWPPRRPPLLLRGLDLCGPQGHRHVAEEGTRL